MIVDAAATRPITESDAPKSLVNKGRTGFFDIVELKIANMPVSTQQDKGGKQSLCHIHLHTIF